ncbi:hypothetical protein CTI12_AA356760 [Artemisia annua]|uniref:Cation/H+ exchanger transmembrane domain-containing protein n=1 Tax=Artemisia annua TaxID=35608 RepID=A0A2U1MPB4_ARTAN|nr:hypothetical protein CTI12_AA356760 [Artemisia annua]
MVRRGNTRILERASSLLTEYYLQNKELTPNILEKLFREACPALSELSLSRDTSSFKVEYVGNPKDAEKILQRTISEFRNQLHGPVIAVVDIHYKPLKLMSLEYVIIDEDFLEMGSLNSWEKELAGLSMALGAFLAGLLLAETEFALQVESNIAPYRGLLLGLFFMTVGMSIDPKLLVSYYPGDGNVHIWKDYTIRGKQKLVTAFSSIHGHRPSVRSVSVVVDWQQTSGYMDFKNDQKMLSGLQPILFSLALKWFVLDLDKEQLLSSIPLASDCSISALAASQVHGGQYATGFVDGSVRLYDIRTPDGQETFSSSISEIKVSISKIVTYLKLDKWAKLQQPCGATAASSCVNF